MKLEDWGVLIFLSLATLAVILIFFGLLAAIKALLVFILT